MSRWKKPKRSNGNGGNNCVEVDLLLDGGARVRDTKQNGQPGQPVLEFTKAEWDAFIADAKDGDFDGHGS